MSGPGEGTAPGGPQVAVVIPARGRGTRLAFALEALAAQTLGSSRFEVLVVRDSDAPPPPLVPEGLVVRFLQIDGISGPAPKRNLGWRSTAAPLVAFTDDDCRPEFEWLERLLAAHVGEDTDKILQGRTIPDPDEAHLLHGLARTVSIDEPSEWFETCNIAYPRSLLERLGGFDESFDFIGDDTDLGLRARAAGVPRRYLPDAVVAHAVFHRSLPEALHEALRRRSTAAIVARHPAQRGVLLMGVFTRANYPRLLLALAGLLLFRRRPLLLAAALAPYVERNLDRERLHAWGLLRLPMQIGSRAAVDAAEIAAAAAASARYRSLVL